VEETLHDRLLTFDGDLVQGVQLRHVRHRGNRAQIVLLDA
jgi:hypothetical protein